MKALSTKQRELLRLLDRGGWYIARPPGAFEHPTRPVYIGEKVAGA